MIAKQLADLCKMQMEIFATALMGQQTSIFQKRISITIREFVNNFIHDFVILFMIP